MSTCQAGKPDLRRKSCSSAPRRTPHQRGSEGAQSHPRWLLPSTDLRIPHELQGRVLYFRTLPSPTASSRAVGEPGTGAYVAKDRAGPDLDDRPHFIQYVTEPSDCFGQIKLFLPARRRPTVGR